ncbi:MAG: hypothetical protein IT559_04440 [Alphaproteobacteria bacterium]|nr:hypothetical protein [Alphaproteobacteria bacterium]
MLGKLCNKPGRTAASAHVVDGRLILSLPLAIRPIVWQMDLSQTKSSALEVREADEGKTHILVLKTPRGETVEIAPFANKNDAIEGLMAVTGAFENAQGQMQPNNTANNASVTTVQGRPPAAKGHGKWLAAILILILTGTLFLLWTSPTGPASQTPIDPQNTAGVPLSADAYLQNR